MERNITSKIQCPYCGKEFEITQYDFINADKDIDLRDKCVSGDLFRVSCPHCKKEYMLLYPVLYFDPSHKFVIWFSAKEMPTTMEALKKEIAKTGYTLRRCATLDEFTEKIQILEDGLDDVMVELAKYDCFIEFIDNKKGTVEDITGITYERADNGIIRINVRTGDKGMAFTIPTSMMEEEMVTDPDKYKVNNEDWPRINRDYIICPIKSRTNNMIKAMIL